MRYRVRIVEFVGEEEFPQGLGMTWDSVELDVRDGDCILDAEATYRHGTTFEGLVPVVRVFLAEPVESFPTENAVSGENGGGGNRTRVTSPAESQAEQGDSPRPRPRGVA